MADKEGAELSLLYPVSALLLVAALIPVWLFGLEALWTRFNADFGLISAIAAYQEASATNDQSLSLLSLVRKMTIPVFAGFSTNKEWRKEYYYLSLFIFWFVVASLLLLFLYEYVIHSKTVKERLSLLSINPSSVSAYLNSYKDPTLVLLGTMIGIRAFQGEANGRGGRS